MKTDVLQRIETRLRERTKNDYHVKLCMTWLATCDDEPQSMTKHKMPIYVQFFAETIMEAING